MKRKVEIEIECGTVTCDNCSFLCHSDRGALWCDLFEVDPIDFGDGPERSATCRAAEKQ